MPPAISPLETFRAPLTTRSPPNSEVPGLTPPDDPIEPDTIKLVSAAANLLEVGQQARLRQDPAGQRVGLFIVGRTVRKPENHERLSPPKSIRYHLLIPV